MLFAGKSTPPPSNGDPAYGTPTSQYFAPQEEVIARAPIRTTGVNPVNHDDFVVDNKAVWILISGLCRDADCWTHVKPHMKKKDGRGAFRGLWDYYLGKQNVDNQATTSEKALELASWTHNTKRFTFDTFVKIHLDHHQVLSDLVDHGYAGIDERSKVRHLLKGIKSTKMDSVKAAILASDKLRSDFSGCVTLYKDFMAQNEGVASPDNRNISGVGSGGNGGKGGGKSKRKRGSDDDDCEKVPCEDRYYSSEEYKKLSPGKRKWLKETRDKRVASGGSRNKNNKRLKATDKAIAVLSSAVDALQVKAQQKTARIAEVATTAAGGDDGDSTSNSTNSALTRIETRQTKK